MAALVVLLHILTLNFSLNQESFMSEFSIRHAINTYALPTH